MFDKPKWHTKYEDVLLLCAEFFSLLSVLQDDTVWTRYFVAENVLDEVTFGWPRQSGGSQLKELLALRLQKAFTSVSSLAKLIPSISSSFYSPLDL